MLIKKNKIWKDYFEYYCIFENRKVVSRFASNISLRLLNGNACAMCYTITTQTRRNLPFDTRAHTCLVSRNDKKKRKQKCYGLISAGEFLRKMRTFKHFRNLFESHQKSSEKLLYIPSFFFLWYPECINYYIDLDK